MKKKVTPEYLFVGVIVLFIIIAATPYITGSVTYAKVAGATCTDSDGGKDYETQGEVKGSVGSRKDWCDASDIVIEYYCSAYGEVVKESYICPENYLCSSGACVKDESVCKDSEGGRRFFIKGTTTRGDKSYTDYCVTEVMVGDYYCEPSGEVGMAKQNCAYGCEDGACIHVS